MTQRLFKLIVFCICFMTACFGQKSLQERQTNFGRQILERVKKGEFKKIKFTDPNALKLCNDLMEGASEKEYLCSFIEIVKPVSNGAALQDYLAPDMCSQLRRLLQTFTSLASQYGQYAALAGAFCFGGMYPACAVGAGFALQAAYFQSYVDQVNSNIYKNCGGS